jgi:hypothetical protein
MVRRQNAAVAGELHRLGAQAVVSSRLVRVPVAMLLIAGGIFSFLPVLGLWMLPLGLILIAQDLTFLQKPMARMLGWIERKWLERKAAKRSS